MLNQKLEQGETITLENGKEYLVFITKTSPEGKEYVFLTTQTDPIEVCFVEQQMTPNGLSLRRIQDQNEKAAVLSLLKGGII